MALRTKPRAAVVRARAGARRVARPIRTHIDYARSRTAYADVAVFHEYSASPSGGGNQFMRGLTREFERRGLTVEWNRISGRTEVCLFNSFNFDAERLRRFAHRDVRLVHRVDGPIGVYRGFDDGTDQRILRLNGEFASATIFQSDFSMKKHRELGLELREPILIPNAPDPEIFHPPQSKPAPSGTKLRVIATSWSANPRKGADTLEWLDRNLDDAEVEVTFAGQSAANLRHIRIAPPLPSRQLADLLREHDIYLAASRDDPCSNALLEGLACGLPAAFLRSGGHPELVGEGGIGFDSPEELPAVFARLREELEARRAGIRVPSLVEVADRYLEVLRG